ncbi:hypothetical protein JXB27_00145 [Candidatus Woesearchaeota archaeon]|nr:hypothetical protein [Candidatus Woesearchaeota archaeon]
MIQEYKWGLGYLIASIILGQTLTFEHGIVLGTNIFTTLVATLLTALVDFSVLAVLLCIIISLCYFYYGYRRSHNKATMTDYKICTYLLPSWKRIKWALIIPLILLALLYVANWASGLGVDEIIPPKNVPQGVHSELFAPKILGSQMMLLGNPIQFAYPFFLIALYVYIFFTLILRITKISWLSKTILVLLVISMIFLIYFGHNLKIEMSNLQNGLTLIREEKFAEANKYCYGERQFLPPPWDSAQVPFVCKITEISVKLSKNQTIDKEINELKTICEKVTINAIKSKCEQTVNDVFGTTKGLK